jgi:hypothetical protein
MMRAILDMRSPDSQPVEVPPDTTPEEFARQMGLHADDYSVIDATPLWEAREDWDDV